MGNINLGVLEYLFTTGGIIVMIVLLGFAFYGIVDVFLWLYQHLQISIK